MSVISSPNEKLLDWSKLKAFADKKINVTKQSNNCFQRAENIVVKVENAGYQHLPAFSTFTSVFKSFLAQGR